MPDYAAIVAQGRQWANSRMTSTANVRRPTGATTTDPDGNRIPVWEVVHAGPVRIGGAINGAGQSQQVEVAGTHLELGVRVAHFPSGTSVRDGDHVEVTAGENAGTVWRIVETDWADQKTALRLPVVATERPTEWG